MRPATIMIGIWGVFGIGLGAWSSNADEIDERPLALRVVDAFPNLTWTSWDFGIDRGTPHPIRPMLVAHAGDGTNRLFVPLQQGAIHLLDEGAASSATKIFLDLSERVAYDDKMNEEGLLGLAFHPRYAETGRFYVYYTNRARRRQNVVAGFQVDPRDPTRADPQSEKILLTIDKPFWNHNGGTIAFGPDGYLYITMGDGGMGNDPFGNGQKLSTLLGKILRIDVDGADEAKNYAIPPDNPYADRAGARGEIWAHGLRNVWRMAFDRETGALWAADVGQDTWEEINLIVKGGNYGWNLREGRHPFVAKGQRPPAEDNQRPDLLEPIWEYHHSLGKSITGGLVYRGRKIPELVGAYLYADYVSGRLWALWYDAEQRRVTANREIPLPQPIVVMSFGEDRDGEVYFTTFAADGRAVYRLEK